MFGFRQGPIDNQFSNKAGYEMFRLTFEVREIAVLYDHLKDNGVMIDELRDRDWTRV